MRKIHCAGALQSIDDMDEALQAYTGKGVADIESANSADSVEAATFNDTLYAFPMTADNGYFLYYDSTVLSEEDVASWDTMLAKADEAGKKVKKSAIRKNDSTRVYFKGNILEISPAQLTEVVKVRVK